MIQNTLQFIRSVTSCIIQMEQADHFSNNNRHTYHTNDHDIMRSCRHIRHSSFMSNAFTFVDGLADAVVKSADTGALAAFSQHMLLDKTSQLALLCKH